jgi:8-oxo-dGTP pyrophosphatase MutT (NUDIX family)
MPKQVAALPLRRLQKGRIEILLITTRRSGKWIIPRGWRGKRLSGSKSAQREAWEEAGVKGKIRRKASASYRYRKKRTRRTINVKVFLLEVKREAGRWKEGHQRTRRWTSPQEALRLIRQRGLQEALRACCRSLAGQDAWVDSISNGNRRASLRQSAP